MSLLPFVRPQVFFKPINPAPFTGFMTSHPPSEDTRDQALEPAEKVRKRSNSVLTEDGESSVKKRRFGHGGDIAEFTDSENATSDSSESSSEDDSNENSAPEEVSSVSFLFPPMKKISISPEPDIYEKLFGSNLKKINFEQGAIGDCYLVAGFDALLQHPAGTAILKKIKIEEMPGTDDGPSLYTVKFPTGQQIIINSTEIGAQRHGRDPLKGPKGLQLLELAYAKLTRSNRNRKLDIPYPRNGRGYSPILVEGGNTKNALHDMLGGQKVDLDASDDTPPGVDISYTDPLSKNPNGLRNLKNTLAEIAADKKNYYLLAACTPSHLPKDKPNYNRIYISKSTSHSPPATREFYRNHYYSVRDFDLKRQTITVVNPHDTATNVYTLTMKEFCDVFQGIDGIKLDKTSI